jgi:hypothetical protein
VVADGEPPLPGVPVEVEDWTEGGEAAALRRMDVGLMPLTDDPFSRGKCGFKILQYAATGIPTVASPVGANAVLVEDGRTGRLAADGAAWEEALLGLGRDAALRGRMGEAARRTAAERWSTEVLGPPLARFLRQVAEGR